MKRFKKILVVVLSAMMVCCMIPAMGVMAETAAPSGKILRAPYVDTGSDRIYVHLGEVAFTASVELELYNGTTLLTTSRLNTNEISAGVYGELTGNIGVGDQTSDTWLTEKWYPLDDVVPTHVAMHIDGKLVETVPVTLTQLGGEELTAEDWVAYPGTLEEAPAAPSPMIPWLESFVTTVGEFDDKTYYCCAAREGDIVTLKVSTSEIGDSLGLDYHNITVKYEVEGAAVVLTGYDYNGSVLYKDGIATDFVLAKGFNKVVTKVYYNGNYVGAFEPFYANVQ